MRALDPSLDLRLLRTLHLLLTERSVSRTAELLGQSQPSVSFALKRLREIVGDPLLVRSGARLVPTERGCELRTSVERVLQDLEEVLSPAEGFDPTSSQRHMRIVAANCLGPFFLPRIVELMRAAAPSMTVDLCPMPTDGNIKAHLETGDVDLVICNWPVPPQNLRCTPLFETQISCMVRPSHPLARRKRIGMAEYLTLDHLSPSLGAHAAVSPIDGRLAQLHLSRRITVTVPEYTVVPYVLARNDVIFTTGRPFAEHLAGLLPFAVLDAPTEFGSMRFHMLWHERSHRTPAHCWLRELARRAALDVITLDCTGVGPRAVSAIAV